METDFAPFNDSQIRYRILQAARAILEQLVRQRTGPLPHQPPRHPGLPESIAALRPGLFVTLKIGTSLRGCIGHITGRESLEEALPELTRAAAFEDPRFPPVRLDELSAIRIEISLLTPPEPVAIWQDIVIGRHGMILARQGRQAVFLPQVAGEQGWDIAATLTALSRKAGLSPDAWRAPDCRFQVFEAIHFAEEA